MSTLLAAHYPGSAAVAGCFDDAALIAAMLRFELGLARAEAELGIIPASAATAIEMAARTASFDPAELAEATASTSNPAIPFVGLLTAHVAEHDAAAAGYVHYGSTSQDVMDSATMLCVRNALVIIDTELSRCVEQMATLATQHSATVMAARTLSQHAGPISFSSRLCGWLRGIAREHRRLRELAATLPLQCAGATASRASFAADGDRLSAVLAAALGLAPAPPWHSERGVVRALGSALAGTCVALGKAATDLVEMSLPEIGEFREGGGAGHGASSALAHKRNPVALIGVRACALQAPGQLATLFSASLQAQERATGEWHAERRALSELCVLAGGAAHRLAAALDGGSFDIASMQRNLERGDGSCMSEAVTLALAPDLGRPAARALVEAALQGAREAGIPFAEALARDARVGEILDAAALARTLDPLEFLGDPHSDVQQTLAVVADLREPVAK